ncbi:MAG: transcriptional activator NhaR [Rhodocyclaceae bacterium]|nr:transcriptional activator NhaR [Rhodocyclaceae bacterium]
MNLKHLYYFWKVAKLGGVVRAAEAIHISPQTLSGQIKLLEARLGAALFVRQGRSLELTDAGRLALEYADDIFTLDAELEHAIRAVPKGRPTDFRVGVSDALPKALAYRLLHPAIELPNPVRIICREWRIEPLLAELALHRLDLVLADWPIPSNIDIRVYTHKLGESGLSFLAHPALARQSAAPFPQCLEHVPLLMPGEDSSMRRRTREWLDRKRLRVTVAGEFDDAALMAAFGRERVGAFPVPSVLLDDYLAAGDLVLLGHADRASIEYFALSASRRLTHPCVVAVTAKANISLEPNHRLPLPAPRRAPAQTEGVASGTSTSRPGAAKKIAARTGNPSSAKIST